MNENNTMSPAPQPEAPVKKPLNKKLIISIGFGVTILIAAIITIVLIVNNQKEPETPTSKAPEKRSISFSPESCADRTKNYFDLTKEDAYEFLQKINDEDSNCLANYLFDGDEDFFLQKGDDFSRLRSYGNESEIEDIANKNFYTNPTVGSSDNEKTVTYKVTQKDGFAIVYDETRESCHAVRCNAGITFDKKYINYSPLNAKGLEDYTTRSDYKVVNGRNEKWLKQAFDLISLTDYNPKSIYTTYMTSDDNYYIYQAFHIGTTHDYNDDLKPTGSNIIELYYETTLIDKKTGKVARTHNPEDEFDYTERYKTFPITKKEALAIH